MVWKLESNRAEDFCNFLSLYAMKAYKLDFDPGIVNFTFYSHESGDYGEEGYVSSGMKTELDFTNNTQTWGVDNEDLTDLLLEYFSGGR